MEEKTDVTEEAQISEDSSPETNEQEVSVSEDVKTSTSDVQRNLRIALQKERERRKAAESQLQQVRYEAPQQIEDDEAVRRFTNVEAITLINNKILTDPSFKDRADLVMDEMKKTGKSIDDADNAVVARLFKDMLQEGQELVEKPKQIKQLPTNATPETTQRVSPEIQAELDMFDGMAKSFGD